MTTESASRLSMPAHEWTSRLPPIGRAATAKPSTSRGRNTPNIPHQVEDLEVDDTPLSADSRSDMRRSLIASLGEAMMPTSKLVRLVEERKRETASPASTPPGWGTIEERFLVEESHSLRRGKAEQAVRMRNEWQAARLKCAFTRAADLMCRTSNGAPRDDDAAAASSPLSKTWSVTLALAHKQKKDDTSDSQQQQQQLDVPPTPPTPSFITRGSWSGAASPVTSLSTSLSASPSPMPSPSRSPSISPAPSSNNSRQSSFRRSSSAVMAIRRAEARPPDKAALRRLSTPQWGGVALVRAPPPPPQHEHARAFAGGAREELVTTEDLHALRRQLQSVCMR